MVTNVEPKQIIRGNDPLEFSVLKFLKFVLAKIYDNSGLANLYPWPFFLHRYNFIFKLSMSN